MIILYSLEEVDEDGQKPFISNNGRYLLAGEVTCTFCKDEFIKEKYLPLNEKEEEYLKQCKANDCSGYLIKLKTGTKKCISCKKEKQ